MQQLSAYESALVAPTNSAHARLFLFICQRLQEKDVDAGDMMEKSDPFAAGLMSMMNDSATGYSRQEVAILFDHFMRWYETPQTGYEGKTKPRTEIRFHVDYAPERDFADLLQEFHATIKERRGPEGAKLPRSWGVGIKCHYSSSKGHAAFEGRTIDHHGQLMKVEPWEQFFQSEDPADEVIALSLEPNMPWAMSYKFFYRQLSRQCNLTIADDPALLAADNYEFGKYLYKSEKEISAEMQYLLVRADSLTKDSYLVKELLRGKRYAKAEEVLLALPQQREFSHSPADMESYCPLLGMMVGEVWYYDFKCKFVMAAEQRRAFALGFAEAAAIAIVAEDRAVRSVNDLLHNIFTDDEKAAIVQLLVKQLQQAVQTKELQPIIAQMQQSKFMKAKGPDEWDLPVRDLELVADSQTKKLATIDARFLAESVALQTRICATMGFSIKDVKRLLKKKAWGLVQQLFATERLTDLALVDRVWLEAIAADKQNLALLIYEQGYPLFHDSTERMNSSGYGDEPNPFATMLKKFPELVLASSRTDATLCPPMGDSYPALSKRLMFRADTLEALAEGLEDRHLVRQLQCCRGLLDKLFPEDADINRQFLGTVKEKFRRYHNGQAIMEVVAANWPIDQRIN